MREIRGRARRGEKIEAAFTATRPPVRRSMSVADAGGSPHKAHRSPPSGFAAGLSEAVWRPSNAIRGRARRSGKREAAYRNPAARLPKRGVADAGARDNGRPQPARVVPSGIESRETE